jgi:hypothetical protein
MTRIKTMSVWLENKIEIDNLTWCLNIPGVPSVWQSRFTKLI